ncbi:MAG: N5-carboxyaminoimidazole ribonucleotide synthase [Phycisphaeraceae bacterium]|nr:MAG: N5-carboxyaminoimidazole ribonucleotide synthase [Phycisphaeraceae bacterium]
MGADGPLVGILGGGQLARLLAQAGEKLGVRCRVLDPNPECSAGRVCEQVVGAYDDADALGRLADGCDVVTYEFENVPVESAEWVAQRVPVHPTPGALRVAQDRLNERELFAQLGVAMPGFVPIDSEHQIAPALTRVGEPALLKARRLGYDGKGQFLVSGAHDAPAAWRAIGGAPAILDAFVPFERELSVVAVRARDGECRFYPPAQNVHRGGILRLTRAPAPGVPAGLRERAESAARAIMDHLGYVGVMAVEFFQTGEGADATLLANEIAPRVHNTGHWTIEGAPASQFENHLRAVLGMELGETAGSVASAMVNAIGELPDPVRVASVPGAVLHDYEKAPRPGRKVGHVTITACSPAELSARLEHYTRVVG